MRLSFSDVERNRIFSLEKLDADRLNSANAKNHYFHTSWASVGVSKRPRHQLDKLLKKREHFLSTGLLKILHRIFFFSCGVFEEYLQMSGRQSRGRADKYASEGVRYRTVLGVESDSI